MPEVVTGWSVDLDRGPDCLLIRLEPEEADSPDTNGLATMLDDLLRLEFAHRVVIDLHHVPCVTQSLIDELQALYRSVSERGGLMRVCGLNPASVKAMKTMQLQGHLPVYTTRQDALRGLCPGKPK